MIWRRFGNVTVIFAAVSVLGAGVMTLWSRARQVEHRVLLRLDDPAQTARFAQVLTQRGEALTPVHGLSRIEVTPAGEAGLLELVIATDREQPLPETFVDSLLARGGIEFARVLGEDEQAGPGHTVREVRFSKTVYSMREPTKIERRSQTFRVAHPSALTVRGPATCDYHTEGLLMAPVLDLRLTGEDAARLEEVTRAHSGRVLALLVNGQMACAARVQDPITDGRIQLRGMRDRIAVKCMARMIEAGPLPCAAEIVRQDFPQGLPRRYAPASSRP